MVGDGRFKPCQFCIFQERGTYIGLLFAALLNTCGASGNFFKPSVGATSTEDEPDILDQRPRMASNGSSRGTVR